MAGKRRDDVREEDVTGLKYFDKLAPLLARLRKVGCERDKAGNRKLHFDQYCMLVLLFLFNPVVRSLRAIEQASELRKVQRKLGCQRASLGSLSEATDVFDPERLKEIIAELGEQLEPIARDPRLKDVQHTLTLVDGTLMKALPVLVQAALPDPRTAKLKAKFQLFNEITAANSSYVCRLRDNSRYEIEEDRPLAAEDVEAGIVLDAIVCLGEYQGVKDRPDHPLRLVVVKTAGPSKSFFAFSSTCWAAGIC